MIFDLLAKNVRHDYDIGVKDHNNMQSLKLSILLCYQNATTLIFYILYILRNISTLFPIAIEFHLIYRCLVYCMLSYTNLNFFCQMLSCIKLSSCRMLSCTNLNFFNLLDAVLHIIIINFCRLLSCKFKLFYWMLSCI